MGKFIIRGGKRLRGEVSISSSKNACLSIISAAVMLDGKVFLNNVKPIKDVIVMAKLIQKLGGDYSFTGDGLALDCRGVNCWSADWHICKQARASFFTAGAILARFRKAVVPTPGGCDLGARPVDMHVAAFEQLGIRAICADGCVYFNGENMHAARVVLPYPSVGVTVNLINAACGIDGQTVIVNAAREPEVKDLCDFLIRCGYRISGGGSREIVVCGNRMPRRLNVEYMPIQDRIEAATYLLAACATGGEIVVRYNYPQHVKMLLSTVKRMGGLVKVEDGALIGSFKNRTCAVGVRADVHPAFPTDMQPLIAGVLVTAKGVSVIEDKVFKSRYAYMEQLRLLGAKYEQSGNKIKIQGVPALKGNWVTATDLRGGAALIIAGLSAEGETVIENAEVIDRGYYFPEHKFSALGGIIDRVLK